MNKNGGSSSQLVKSYNGPYPSMRDRPDPFGGNNRQALQIGAPLFLQPWVHQRVSSNLFLKFLEDNLPLRFLSVVLAGECVEEVSPAVDGHAQSKGDVALESILHAQEGVLLGDGYL